jgi:DNA invertase Pin-like site-specific DNA recombinase
MSDRIYTKAQVKEALEKHETRAAVALALDCSVSTVSRLIDKTFPDLKHLAKWKIKSKKIWGY